MMNPSDDLLLPANFFLPVLIGLVMLADYLFFDWPIGWTLGGYLLLLGVIVLPRSRQSFRQFPVWFGAGLLLINGLSIVFQPNALNILLAILGLLLYRFGVKGLKTTDLSLPVLLRRYLVFGTTGWFNWVIDLDNRLNRRDRRWLRQFLRVFCFWVLPLGLALFFLNFFIAANPLVEQLCTAITRFLEQWWSKVNLRRVLFWLLFAALLWGFLRLLAGKQVCQKIGFIGNFCRNIGEIFTSFSGGRSPAEKPDTAKRLAGKLGMDTVSFFRLLITRCLVFLNLVFLLPNIFDIEYLWAGVALPEGMTFAAYAHRGAYPLIVTALLAALITIVFFSGDRRGREWKLTRYLVYLFLFQNVFLVISSLLRLEKYVTIYSLTLLRFAAGIWMLLVVAGLVWIMLKILLHRSNFWLVNTNLLTLILLLTLLGWLPIRGWIACFNVQNCREVASAGQTITPESPAELDIEYLQLLGPEALPAFDLLSTRYAAQFPAASYLPYYHGLIAGLRDRLPNWRAWSLLDARLLARYDAATVEQAEALPERPNRRQLYRR